MIKRPRGLQTVRHRVTTEHYVRQLRLPKQMGLRPNRLMFDGNLGRSEELPYTPLFVLLYHVHYTGNVCQGEVHRFPCSGQSEIEGR